MPPAQAAVPQLAHPEVFWLILLNTLAVDGGVGSPVVGADVLPETDTVAVTVAEPKAPVESHARTMSWCAPVEALIAALIVEVAEPV